MVDVDNLKSCLADLLIQYSSKEAKETIETLLRIHRNILENEDHLRFRRLKPENPTFSKKVWSLRPARDFMYACGWLEVRDLLVFNSDEKLVDIINVLLEHRLVVVPNESEWKDETKCENLNYSQEREEELRRQAALQREKEVQEFQKDKMYRQQLNETIKAQIASDRQHEWKRYTKPVVGNQLNKRAKSTKTSSGSAGTQNFRR